MDSNNYVDFLDELIKMNEAERKTLYEHFKNKDIKIPYYCVFETGNERCDDESEGYLIEVNNKYDNLLFKCTDFWINGGGVAKSDRYELQFKKFYTKHFNVYSLNHYLVQETHWIVVQNKETKEIRISYEDGTLEFEILQKLLLEEINYEKLYSYDDLLISPWSLKYNGEIVFVLNKNQASASKLLKSLNNDSEDKIYELKFYDPMFEPFMNYIDIKKGRVDRQKLITLFTKKNMDKIEIVMKELQMIFY